METINISTADLRNVGRRKGKGKLGVQLQPLRWGKGAVKAIMICFTYDRICSKELIDARLLERSEGKVRIVGKGFPLRFELTLQ